MSGIPLSGFLEGKHCSVAAENWSWAFIVKVTRDLTRGTCTNSSQPLLARTFQPFHLLSLRRMQKDGRRWPAWVKYDITRHLEWIQTASQKQKLISDHMSCIWYKTFNLFTSAKSRGFSENFWGIHISGAGGSPKEEPSTGWFKPIPVRPLCKVHCQASKKSCRTLTFSLGNLECNSPDRRWVENSNHRSEVTDFQMCTPGHPVHCF